MRRIKACSESLEGEKEHRRVERARSLRRGTEGEKHLRGARGRDLERRSAYWRSSGTISRWCRHKSRHHVHAARPHSTPPINFLISPAGAPSRSSREERRKTERERERGERERSRREIGCYRGPLFGVEHLVSILSDTRSTSPPRPRCIRISRRSMPTRNTRFSSASIMLEGDKNRANSRAIYHLRGKRCHLALWA